MKFPAQTRQMIRISARSRAGMECGDMATSMSPGMVCVKSVD
jgi:hypothetical protein